MRILKCAVACSALAISAAASAGGGKLLATGGVTQFEGAAGGGLTPWALIGGYETRDEIGGTLFYTRLDTREYGLNALGFTLGLFDRIELSYARQSLGVDSTIIANTAGALIAGLTPILGPASAPIAPSTTINQDVFGAKVRLFGDAIYSQASFVPQVALGAQYKRNRDFDSGVTVPYLGDVGIPNLLGAKDEDGIDVYLSATKVLLGVPAGKILLLNATARATKANAFGLLGAPNLAKENTAKDFFIAYVPNKSIAFTAAYVDLGNLPFQEDSEGYYLSVQGSF